MAGGRKKSLRFSYKSYKMEEDFYKNIIAPLIDLLMSLKYSNLEFEKRNFIFEGRHIQCFVVGKYLVELMCSHINVFVEKEESKMFIFKSKIFLKVFDFYRNNFSFSGTRLVNIDTDLFVDFLSDFDVFSKKIKQNNDELNFRKMNVKLLDIANKMNKIMAWFISAQNGPIFYLKEFIYYVIK